jgi:hypothetical protein
MACSSIFTSNFIIDQSPKCNSGGTVSLRNVKVEVQSVTEM